MTKNSKIIELPINVVSEILSQAQQNSEQEICGFIAEKNGCISHVYPIENAATNPQEFFQMNGKEQITVMREMRERGESLFAIYHSHPRGNAYPSRTDIAQSEYPDVNYLIVSLGIKGVLDLGGFRIRNGEVDSLEVRVESDSF